MTNQSDVAETIRFGRNKRTARSETRRITEWPKQSDLTETNTLREAKCTESESENGARMDARRINQIEQGKHVAVSESKRLTALPADAAGADTGWDVHTTTKQSD